MAAAICQSKAAVFTGRSLRTSSARAQRPRAAPIRAAAAERQVWYPGNDPAPHLDGSLPGDYGFDPLGLAVNPEALRWNQQAELIHSRLAMTAVAGIIFPSVATKAGVLNVPEWYDAGKVWIREHPAFPFVPMLFVQLLLTGWAEGKRWADFNNPGSQGDGSFLGITDGLKGQSNGYPGGPWFDFLGLSRGSEEQVIRYKENEIKNGRLAMVAMLGFFVQYAATNKGPITNLLDHIKDPYHINFAANGVSLPFVS